jgi:hypothetical protein
MSWIRDLATGTEIFLAPEILTLLQAGALVIENCGISNVFWIYRDIWSSLHNVCFICIKESEINDALKTAYRNFELAYLGEFDYKIKNNQKLKN